MRLGKPQTAQHHKFPYISAKSEAMQNFFLCCVLLALSVSPVYSQQQYETFALNRGNALLFDVSYGFHQPGGDLNDRFGEHFSIGSGVEWLTDKGSWIMGASFNYYFGTSVKENPLASLLNDEGFLIGNDREYADIGLRMRGFYAGVHLGKLISLGFKNPRSGIRLTVSGGLLQHKIRIQKDPVRRVPQISDEYEKGYDRLTNGLAFTEFIGYQLLSSNRRINFFAGFEFTQGLTMSRRSFNFDTRQQNTASRLDLDYGFRVGWILPFYMGERASEEIYY